MSNGQPFLFYRYISVTCCLTDSSQYWNCENQTKEKTIFNFLWNERYVDEVKIKMMTTTLKSKRLNKSPTSRYSFKYFIRLFKRIVFHWSFCMNFWILKFYFVLVQWTKFWFDSNRENNLPVCQKCWLHFVVTKFIL